jgi:hypothetical protein
MRGMLMEEQYWTAISDRARTLPTEPAEAFGTFYIMTTVLPLVSSMLHWVYVNPSYSLQPYRYTILHTMNVAIVLLEVLVLNSIAKPGIVWVHVCVLGMLTVLYCELWVVVGNVFSEMELREGWLDWRFFGGDKEMGRELTSGITWVGLLWVAACFYGVWTVEWYKDALMAAAERWERDEITRWVDGQRGAGTRLQAVSVVDRMSV